MMKQHLNRRTWLKHSGLATGAWSTGALAAAEAPRAAEGSVAFQRNILVKHTVDVFVAGGGSAGVAAALAAEKQLSTHRVDVAELQRKLKLLGAYLPNA